MSEFMTGSAPEEWREVCTHPDYEASSWGRVRRKPFQIVMHHGGVRWYGGEPRVGAVRKRDKRLVITLDQAGRQLVVSRLVCAAFHGPPPADKPVCMHGDDDPQNNRPGNLSWGSKSENANAPRCLALHRQHGVRRKLNAEQVLAIRAACKAGVPQSKLAAQYGLTEPGISNIKRRATWKHLPEPASAI